MKPSKGVVGVGERVDSYMLVQFCSWFQFYVPLFKSHALLYTTMAKKKENINIHKVYIEQNHSLSLFEELKTNKSVF